MEIVVCNGVEMLVYTGMRLWSLFAGFDFESITWYWKYKGDSAKIFRKYLLEERPINSLKKKKIQGLTKALVAVHSYCRATGWSADKESHKFKVLIS